MPVQGDIEGTELGVAFSLFSAHPAPTLTPPSELAYHSKRLFRVDPHTGNAAKPLDEGINLYRGIV